MKKLFIAVLIVAGVFMFSCVEETIYTPLQYLTMHSWHPDSLLANGESAGGPGELLEKFNGQAQFYENGTGLFGTFEGTWYFSDEETKIVIASDSLSFPVTMNIVELSELHLKLTTVFPNLTDPLNPFNIRLTFKSE